MFDLSGMTALITGASGGLGSAIAQALSKQGARLAVSGSNVDKLEKFPASSRRIVKPLGCGAAEELIRSPGGSWFRGAAIALMGGGE